MATINTTLTTSGNSTAVRLPKELLRMSGISDKSRVTLEAKKGKIIISKNVDPREGWADQIQALITTAGDPTAEFSEMAAASADGLDDLAWDGPSFESWQTARGNKP